MCLECGVKGQEGKYFLYKTEKSASLKHKADFMTYGVSSQTLGAGEVTQSAEYWFSIHEPPVCSATPHNWV